MAQFDPPTPSYGNLSFTRDAPLSNLLDSMIGWPSEDYQRSSYGAQPTYDGQQQYPTTPQHPTNTTYLPPPGGFSTNQIGFRPGQGAYVPASLALANVQPYYRDLPPADQQCYPSPQRQGASDPTQYPHHPQRLVNQPLDRSTAPPYHRHTRQLHRAGPTLMPPQQALPQTY